MKWTVRQHRDVIHTGDTVFLWLSGNEGGLLARGTVRTEPGHYAESDEERQFYRDPVEPNDQLRVNVSIDHIYETPVRRAALLQHPVLAAMQLMRSPQGTNFPLSVREAAALEALCHSQPGFAELMRRYREDGTVFQSAERGALYIVTAVDESGCVVTRLSANEPERCTFGLYEKKLAMVREHGGRFPFPELDGTAAKRTAYLQGIELGLTQDLKEVVDLSDEDDALGHFCTGTRSRAELAENKGFLSV
jgi:hypothetical protein